MAKRENHPTARATGGRLNSVLGEMALRPLSGVLLSGFPFVNGVKSHDKAFKVNFADVGKESRPYLEELGVNIVNRRRPIKFLANADAPVHRWSPYVQGFAAAFVREILDEYQERGESPVVLDPFAGSGTVLVASKLHGFDACGVEINPLLHFVTQAKTGSWTVSPTRLAKVADKVKKCKSLGDAPDFLQSERHFSPGVLRNLRRLKAGIDGFKPVEKGDHRVMDLLRLTFSSLLINCANLKRSPCLTRCPKNLSNDAPFRFFEDKIRNIANDLESLQRSRRKSVKSRCRVLLANSITYEHPAGSFDLVITSPPYMNGMDYVINYKIEMGWLGFSNSQKELKRIKDQMVVCDNVSKGMMRDYAKRHKCYSNKWIEKIKYAIATNIRKRAKNGKPYRRPDMPEIVHKYFDDMHKAMRKIKAALRPKGRFIMVVGDSLIADVYVPTDLILAKMGKDMGMIIAGMEKARDRRSGQVRDYKLRETIVELRKK